jgi:CheY-like chemotaxis protein/HPt (histidine-containing phosphotransfer) domain-containing protein
LRQILINLLSNAIKFSHQGAIVLSVAKLEENVNRVVLHFQIVDNGIGVHPEVQNKIFEIFSQGDESTTRKYGGTGLGLAIARQLTEMMGGEIGVTSKPGNGSTFWFTSRFFCEPTEREPHADLEFNPPKALHPPKIDIALESERTNPAPVGRILVVEDNLVNREVVVTMLKNLYYDVVIANNGQEAFQAFQNNAIDLVFMDCQMPIMDGYDATRAIRVLEQEDDTSSSKHTPIIALTAHAFNSDKERCISAGMDDYLKKPLNFQQLTVTLHRWLLSSQEEVSSAPMPLSEPANLGWHQNKLIGIDSKALDNILAINRDNGHDVLAKVISLYLDNSDDLMNSLREGLNGNDFPAISAAAHRLTSSSATLGAQKLAALCRQLEIICHGRFIDKAAAIFLTIETEYKRVCQTLTTILANQMAGLLDDGKKLP